MSPESIGRVVRARRKALGLRQAELAGICGVGNRFLSELENGKATVELGRALRVFESLGLSFDLRQRAWRDLEFDGSN